MNKFYPLIDKLLAIALVVFVVGCASQTVVDDTTIDAQKMSSDDAPDVPDADKPVFGANKNGSANDERDDRRVPDLYAGTGKLVNMPPVDSPVRITGEAVMLNFDETPLADVVHGVLGDILGLSYTLDAPLKGTATLRSRNPLQREELLGIVESLLRSNGFVMIRDDSNRFVITPSDGAVQKSLRYRNSRDSGVGFANIIVSLDHIGAEQMTDILKPVAPESAFVRVDGARNLLILSGTRAQLDSWLDIVDMFDVDMLEGMSVGIFPIEYNAVADVVAALESLMSTASSGDEAALDGMVKTVPLESLGSVLVVTPRESYLKKVGTWIERLDKAPESGVEPQLYVYSVQNGTADHLAQLISSVFGGMGGGSSSSANRQRNAGVSPGLTPSSLSSESAGASTAATSAGGGNSSRTQRGSSSYSLGDSAKIVADQVNNSLLVYATSSEYRKIETALKQLDVMPSQILIEASIIEVTLNEDLQYGLEWYMENNLKGGWSGTGYAGIGPDSSGNVSVNIPSFGYTFTNPMSSIQAVLEAVSDKELIKVLSTPSIMVLDNHAAKIHVGTQQPIRTSSTIIEGGGVSNSINYKETGVKLDVVPSVNAGGLVTLDLIQSVTDVGDPDDVTGQVSFFERNIESRVAVRSGETVVLGGLISDNQTKGKTGLPFLSELPIIGNLFGSTRVIERRTELLVVITPHVIQTEQDLRNITEEMRGRMRGLEAFERTFDPDKLVNE
ncbi:type II secretion system secretin GspD [Gilvimarinus algae]|uniref:Type II secretion system secretin GspD n=1 Tax=Gilvimarinus algae TaxID=3058037 RepID=A0ABT8THK3_9GAMM|nr:type II secretion system secretin GspD [Gilvimarinus sp. SDUM040014]MDO3383581.1 type II secretion system secretin GspD [Gilvimarinus sp. SDUM040014]